MPDLEIISEKPFSLVDMKEKLAEIKKRDKELNFRAKKTEDYLNIMAKIKPNKAKELKDEIENLKIIRLKERHIIKIIDLLPKDLDSLKTIFANESVTIKPEELSSILNIVKKYV